MSSGNLPTSIKQAIKNKNKIQTCRAERVYSASQTLGYNLQTNIPADISVNKLIYNSLKTKVKSYDTSRTTKKEPTSFQTESKNPNSLSSTYKKQCCSKKSLQKPKEPLKTCNSSSINSFGRIPLKLKNKQTIMQMENKIGKPIKKEVDNNFSKANFELCADFHKDKTINKNKVKKDKKELKDFKVKTEKKENLVINTKVPGTGALNCTSVAKDKNHKKNKKKAKKRNNIKIVINVHYDSTPKTCNPKEIENCKVEENTDFDFLDDFDVDEIVESLYSCKNTIASSDNFNDKSLNGSENKLKLDKRKRSRTTTKKDLKKHRLVKTTAGVQNKKNFITKSKHKIRNVLSQIPDNLVTKSNAKCAKNFVYQKGISEENGSIKAIDNKNKTKMLSPEDSNSKETKINIEKIPVKSITNKLNIANGVKLKKEIIKEDITQPQYKEKIAEDENKNKEIKIKEESSNDEYSIKVNSQKSKLNDIVVETLETKIFHILMQKYSVNSVIHCGKFSKIFKCSNWATGKFYAVKILDNNDCSNGRKMDKLLKDIQKEIPIENLSCIFLKTSFELNDHCCFMSHYYPINLLQLLHTKKFLINDEICKLSMQLVQAVFILRNKNIVHADIKPGHILLNSEADELKLCGFDEAYYYYNSNNLSPHTGTVNYRSPELILGYSNGFSMDIWSTGLVMYEMATSCKLFPGETNHDVLHRQICTLGNMPNNMIIKSKYAKDYFDGTTFKETSPCTKLIHASKNSTEKDNDLKLLTIDIQKKRCGDNVNKKKFDLFCSLLKKMLVLDPDRRLPIEYVYANPFF